MTAGRAEVGRMVWAPGPEMLKAIRSGPLTLGVLLASRMAWRSEPAPLSSVLRTVKVAGTERSSSRSRCGVQVACRWCSRRRGPPGGRGRALGRRFSHEVRVMGIDSFPGSEGRPPSDCFTK